MAFRIEALCCAVLTLAAQPLTYTAKKHTLTADAAGVTLDQHHWDYADIQRLTLSPARVTILTYEDRKWKPGLEREFTFDHLPDGAAAQLYPLFRAHMDQRFIAQIAEPVPADALFTAPAKLELGLHGANGTLTIGADRIVFATTERNGARTWLYSDVVNISHAGLFDLSLTTQLGAQVQFTLKEPLTEDRYHALWMRLEEANGLKAYQSRLGQH